jgi:hypothetical protein
MSLPLSSSLTRLPRSEITPEPLLSGIEKRRGAAHERSQDVAAQVTVARIRCDDKSDKLRSVPSWPSCSILTSVADSGAAGSRAAAQGEAPVVAPSVWLLRVGWRL